MLCERFADLVSVTMSLDEWFSLNPWERHWLHRACCQFQYQPRVTIRFFAASWERAKHFFPDLRERLVAELTSL